MLLDQFATVPMSIGVISLTRTCIASVRKWSEICVFRRVGMRIVYIDDENMKLKLSLKLESSLDHWMALFLHSMIIFKYINMKLFIFVLISPLFIEGPRNSPVV